MIITLHMMEIDITINLYTYHCTASMFSCVCVCVSCVLIVWVHLWLKPLEPQQTSSLPQVVEYTSLWACVCSRILHRKIPSHSHAPFPTLTCNKPMLTYHPNVSSHD